MLRSILRMLGFDSAPDTVPVPGEQVEWSRLKNAEHRADRSPTGYSAFTFPSNRPAEGPWRISHERVEVAGVHHYATSVRTFAREIDVGSAPFGLCLELEPSNPYDNNAIKVLGITRSRPDGIMLGYIPRELAAELSGKEPLAAEAARYYESGNYSELMINVLERIPTKAEEAENLQGIDAATISIDPDEHPAELIQIAKRMKRVGQRDDAATLFERVVDVHKDGDHWHGAVAPLAAIYRQRKEFEKEQALLELLFSRPVPRGRTYDELHKRLERSRQRPSVSD